MISAFSLWFRLLCRTNYCLVDSEWPYFSMQRSLQILFIFVLPCFAAETAYKIWWYSSGGSKIPFLGNVVVSNTVACVLDLCSWFYRTVVFFLVCVLFRLLCYLQILRMQDFALVFQGDSEVEAVLKEHLRIRRQLRIISHRYRAFILLGLISITASQFASLLMTTRPNAHLNIFNSGELAVSIYWSFTYSWFHPAIISSGFFFFFIRNVTCFSPQIKIIPMIHLLSFSPSDHFCHFLIHYVAYISPKFKTLVIDLFLISSCDEFDHFFIHNVTCTSPQTQILVIHLIMIPFVIIFAISSFVMLLVLVLKVFCISHAALLPQPPSWADDSVEKCSQNHTQGARCDMPGRQVARLCYNRLFWQCWRWDSGCKRSWRSVRWKFQWVIWLWRCWRWRRWTR